MRLLHLNLLDRWVPGLFLSALAMRLWNIDRIPLWLDETALIEQAKRPFLDLLHDVVAVHPTPPLYFLLMGGWIPNVPAGEVWVRLPSAVFGAAFVPAVAWLAEELGGRRAAFLGGLLALFAPLALWYAQEVRTYAFSMFLAAVVMALTLRYLRRGSFVLVPVIALATIAMELSHYAAVLILAIATIVCLAYPTGRDRRGWALAALWVGALPLLLTQEAQDYLRNLDRNFIMLVDSGRLPTGASPVEFAGQLSSFVGPWTRLVGGPAIALLPAYGQFVAALSAVSLLPVLLFGNHPTRLVLLGFVLACAVASVFPQTRALLSERYLTLTLGPLLAACAATVAQTDCRRAAAVMALVLALFLSADAIYWFDPRVGKGPNYRDPALYLASAAQPGDILVETDQDHTFKYYALDVLGAPVREVRPRTGFDGSSIQEIGQDLEQAVRGVRTIWYMPRWTEIYWDPNHNVRSWLDANLCLESASAFDVVELRRYVNAPQCQGGAVAASEARLV